MTQTKTKEILNGRYIISEDGTVTNAKTGRNLKPNCGIITLYDTPNKINIRLNTLVAQTFIPNPKKYKYVIHRDGNYTNCNASNLLWSKRFYKSSGCLAFFDETGIPHLFRGYNDFSKRTGFTRNQELAQLIRGNRERVGPYYSKKSLEDKMNEIFNEEDRLKVLQIEDTLDKIDNISNIGKTKNKHNIDKAKS